MDILGKVQRYLEQLSLGNFRKNRTDFYKSLAKAIQNKEQLKTYLTEELKIARNKKTRNDSRAVALSMLIRRLSSGEEFEFANLLKGIVPDSDRMMLSAVDSSQDKAKTLMALCTAINEQNASKKVIWQALLPPMILVPAVAVFCYVLSTQTLPIIVKIAPPEVWTPFNSAVRAFSEFVSNQGAYLLMAVVASIVAFTKALPKVTGPARDYIEKISVGKATMLMPVAPFILPTIIYKDFQSAQMLAALAVLLQSGATLKDALIGIRKGSTPYMREHINRVLRHLDNSPTDYVNAFSRGLLNRNILGRMASTIRTNSKFEEVLIEIGTRGGEDVREELGKVAKQANFMIMALAGFTVVFLYVGQLSIGDAMNSALDPVNLLKKNR